MVMVSSKNWFCFFHSNIDFYPFPTKKLIHSCNKTGPTGACLKPFHGYQHHGGGHVGGPRCIDGLSCSGKRKDASTDPYMLINQVTYIYVSQMMSRYTGVNIYIMFIIYSIVYTTHLWFFIYNILLISKNIESMNHKWIYVINWCGEETVMSHSSEFPGLSGLHSALSALINPFRRFDQGLHPKPQEAPTDIEKGLVISGFFCCAKIIQTYPKTPPTGKLTCPGWSRQRCPAMALGWFFGWTKFGKKPVEMDHFFQRQNLGDSIRHYRISKMTTKIQ